MAMERLHMRNIREILRLKWDLKKSHREVSACLRVSAGVVANTITRAHHAGLTLDALKTMSDQQIEQQLYPDATPRDTPRRPLPDLNYLHAERLKSGVTMQLLHCEYLEKYPDGYRYAQFCNYYRRWLKDRRLSMRQTHRAGDKMFVDYSGKKPHIVDPTTGEVIEVELFVAVLGASNYTYAEATRTQKSPDWIQSHVHAFEYFGGVTAALVPDQLKSGVTQPCRYEPGAQRTYEELARHYNSAVMPARPYRAKDKAKVEVGVQVAQRWILARLRHETYFSIEALNDRIDELLEDLNHKHMRLYGVSRRQLFETIEKSVLQKLPEHRFVFAEWKQVGVGIDYHIEVDHHYYSVPYELRCQHRIKLEARITSNTVEVFDRGERVASHVRNFVRGGHTTVVEHMPKAHQKHLEWTPSRILHWAQTIGPHTQTLAENILKERPHPEMGYRSCLGIFRLGKQYGETRLEAACARALSVRARSYRHVAAILKNGLDRLPLPSSPQTSKPEQLPLLHEYVRGRNYYH